MTRILRFLSGSLLVFVGTWFALLPGFLSAWYLCFDRGLVGDGPSRFAIRIHRNLSERYAEYARERIASGAATRLRLDQIGETEWPLFGSCFYLWATEALQTDWKENPNLFPSEPTVYAREAIEAAKDLVIDPGHATWVKDHWGDDYLHRENCFYRMLVISALTSHANLTNSTAHLDFLREQTKGLADVIASSPYGWIDDYPGQCYPGDVAAAIAAIMRADRVLGIDRTEFYEKSLRGFVGPRAEPYGLPPYAGDDETGRPYDPSRGCGNSYFLTFAPTVWPGPAEEWYEAYETHFWHGHGFAAGFNEFVESPGAVYYDIDAGPVLFNLGTAATAFATGAARCNGRFDHARTLSSELIVASWPLANGTLLLPRIFSSQFSTGHAPFLGEAAIAFQLTREPHAAAAIVQDGSYVPGVVWLSLALYFLVAALTMWFGCRMLRKAMAGGRR